jgi:hypothetical protein
MIIQSATEVEYRDAESNSVLSVKVHRNPGAAGSNVISLHLNHHGESTGVIDHEGRQVSVSLPDARAQSILEASLVLSIPVTELMIEDKVFVRGKVNVT